MGSPANMGSLVNNSRSWARGIINYCSMENDDNGEVINVKRRLIYRHIAFLYALKAALRNQDWEAYKKYAEENEVKQVEKHSNKHNAILNLHEALFVNSLSNETHKVKQTTENIMKTVAICFILAFFTTSTIAQTNKLPQADNSKPFVLGVVDEIQSTELGEKRTLNIYLPKGSNKNDTFKYPITYLLDGSADEDFIHVVGLFQFNNFEWINCVPKSIVVGIGTADRRRDFTYPTTIEKDKKRYPTTGHSDKFIAFIAKELQPFIEKKYKGSAAKTIIGQSLGGLLATEILVKQPTLFNKYIIISPSLWWDNGSLLNQTSTGLSDSLSHKTDVYIGVGKEGLTPTDVPRVMEVDANLLAEKIKNQKSKSINVYLDYLPQENHATIMHQAVYNALRILYPASTAN